MLSVASAMCLSRRRYDLVNMGGAKLNSQPFLSVFGLQSDHAGTLVLAVSSPTAYIESSSFRPDDLALQRLMRA